MTEFWVCGDCRSINPLRSDRCYKCRAPRPPEGQELAAAHLPALEAKPEPARPANPIPAMTFGPTPVPLPRPTEAAPTAPARTAIGASASAAINPAARVATVPAAGIGIGLMIVVLGIRLILTRISLGVTEGVLNGEGAAESDTDLLGILGLIYPFLGVLAIGGLGLWASRVIRNVPLLGGGWPRFTPGQAFLEHVIPGLNILRTPGVYREIQLRLSGDGAGNDLLIVTWVLVNIAAIVIVRPIGSVLVGFAPTIEGELAAITIVNYLSIGLQGLAILLIAVLVAEIEGQQAARTRELLGERTTTRPALARTGAAAAGSPDVRTAVASRSITAVARSRAVARRPTGDGPASSGAKGSR